MNLYFHNLKTCQIGKVVLYLDVKNNIYASITESSSGVWLPLSRQNCFSKKLLPLSYVRNIYLIICRWCVGSTSLKRSKENSSELCKRNLKCWKLIFLANLPHISKCSQNKRDGCTELKTKRRFLQLMWVVLH